MALFVDDLDRTITIQDVPHIYNAVYSTSLEELSAEVLYDLVRLLGAVVHHLATSQSY